MRATPLSSREVASVSLFAFIALLPAIGLAQQDVRLSSVEEAAWSETVRQATSALDRGDYADAATLCERAVRVRVTPSLRYCLALTAERAGRVVDACTQARQCEATAGQDANLQRRAFISERCGQIVARQCTRTGRVRIQIEGTLPDGAEVLVNHEVVRPSVVGLDVPIVAGEVAVDVSASGYVAVHEIATVAPGEVRVITVRMVPVPRTVVSVPVPAVMTRRSWEAALGAAAVAGAGVLLSVGIYNAAIHSTDSSLNPATGTIDRECALGASTRAVANGGVECDGIGVVTPLLLGAGVVVAGVGAFLIYDGMRLRPARPVSALVPRVLALRDGALIGVSASF